MIFTWVDIWVIFGILAIWEILKNIIQQILGDVERQNTISIIQNQSFMADNQLMIGSMVKMILDREKEQDFR